MKLRIVFLSLGILALSACGGEPTAARDLSGTAIVSMTSGHAADGAVIVTVRGPGLADAQALDSTLTVFWRLAGPTELKVLVLGEAVGPGPLFTVPVSAVNRLSAYSVQIDQVAMQSDSLRSDLTGYQTALSTR